MNRLEWIAPQLNPANPGSGSAAMQLFEGRKQMGLKIFVREDLQNRVDARRPGHDGPIFVRIVRQSLNPKLIDRYFPEAFRQWFKDSETQGMKPQEEKRQRQAIDAIFARDAMAVLVIEDFGGTGLNGPVNSLIAVNDADSPLHHDTNALTCFFRLNGESGKTKKMLGAAGLGRHVYYKASEISSKLIYTVPTDLSEKSGNKLVALEARPLFFGQSFQRELAQRDGDTERRYCAYLHMSAGPQDGLPMPFGIAKDDAEIVEQMRKDFRLKRRPEQPGCSLVIPFPKKNFTEDGLVRTIVREFAMPIITGQLTVAVGQVDITAQNLAQLSDDAQVNLHNEFLASALRATPDVQVKVPMSCLQSPFDEDLFDQRDIDRLATTFNDGGLICLHATLQYGPRTEQAGLIRVAARKSDGDFKGRHLVSRSGLVLSKYSDSNFNKRTNALVRVNDDALGSVLRAIENPAHTEWLPGDVDEHACPCADDLIRFIRYAHREFIRMLVNRDTEDDVTIFSDLVPSAGHPPPPPTTPPNDTPFEVRLESRGDAIHIETASDYEADPGTIWRVTLVYDSIQGSGRARKAHRPGSFNLREVPVTVAGGRILTRGACFLDAEIADPKSFRLLIGPCGFTWWADIRFRADLHSSRMDTHT